jgi:SAM-dependent methyltransferase
MAYAYHADRRRYFEHQRLVTAEYVIPFIEESGPLHRHSHVLEIGCGEAGVLKAFLDRGATAVGVDRNPTRLERGAALLSEDIAAGRIALLHKDANTLLDDETHRGAFDLIVMKDVIEHIEDRSQRST